MMQLKLDVAVPVDGHELVYRVFGGLPTVEVHKHNKHLTSFAIDVIPGDKKAVVESGGTIIHSELVDIDQQTIDVDNPQAIVNAAKALQPA